MNKTGFKFAWVVLGVVLCCSTSPIRAEEKPSVGKRAKATEKDGDATTAPRIAVRVDNARRLRSMMDEKMKLSIQQAAEVNRIFDDYVEDLKANKRLTPGSSPPANNKILPLTYPQLDKELKTAEALGDKVRIEELKQQMSSLRRDPTAQGDDFSDALAAKIKERLQKDQIESFEKVFARWQAITPRGPRTGPLQRLRRALKDPDVGLSADVQKQADDRLEQATKESRRGKRSSLEMMEEEVENARKDIYVQLTPEQQKKVDANLRYFKEVEKQYVDPVKFNARESAAKSKAKSKGPAADAEVEPKASETTVPSEPKPAESKP